MARIPLAEIALNADFSRVNPTVFVVPMVIVASGVLCFFILPLQFELRALILASDILVAGLVGYVLWRRAR